MTAKQIRDYMKARHPGARFVRAADSWYIGPSNSMSAAEARMAAETETDLYRLGIATRPKWLEEKQS